MTITRVRKIASWKLTRPESNAGGFLGPSFCFAGFTVKIQYKMQSRDSHVINHVIQAPGKACYQSIDNDEWNALI